MGRGHIWGDEGRRNIRGRYGWLWEIYEGGRGEICGVDGFSSMHANVQSIK